VKTVSPEAESGLPCEAKRRIIVQFAAAETNHYRCATWHFFQADILLLSHGIYFAIADG
jgi:hypothetical protein